MRFLRGDGPDLSLDEVFQSLLEDGSSSSSDASSELVEEHARFVAAQARSAQILIFGRKGLPCEVFTRGAEQQSISNPIVISASALAAAAPPTSAGLTGLEIVPWRPIRDVIALELLPTVLECRRVAKSLAETQATPVILLGGPSDSGPTGPSDSGPAQFEFQIGQN